MRINQMAGQKPVLAYLQKHAAMIYSAETLAAEMGLGTDQEKPVGKSLSTLHNKGLLDRVGRGQYLFRKLPAEKVTAKPVEPPPADEPTIGDIYEVVGRTGEGAVVIRDTKGTLGTFLPL